MKRAKRKEKSPRLFSLFSFTCLPADHGTTTCASLDAGPVPNVFFARTRKLGRARPDTRGERGVQYACVEYREIRLAG